MPRTTRALFLATIALSAFLLFTLELVAGRLVLPVFGGTPGVWATTLCFFTIVLFLAYGYAHLVATHFGPRRGGIVQLALAVVAIGGMLLAPTDVAVLRNPDLPEALNVLVAQLVIAGPAAFLLASTTPLLSSWYARRGWDAWWLYAVSNGASFVGLIAYPFLIAPTIGLEAQRQLLLLGVAAYALGIAGIVTIGSRVSAANAEPEGTIGDSTSTEPAPTRGPEPLAPLRPAHLTLRRQAIWLFAAFVPAGLLAATTNFITTDLISAPLLWVGPLSIYLLSFVIAFSRRGRGAVRVAGVVVPAAAALLWIPWFALTSWPISATLLVEFGAFFVLAIAIHGRLAADRPDPANLTRFYLILSAGGMLATAFVALLAPLIFNGIYEYPLLIIAALAALAVLPNEGAGTISMKPRHLLRDAAIRLVPYLVATAVLVVLITGGSFDNLEAVLGLFLVGGYAIAIAIWPVVLPISTAVAIVLSALASPNPTLLQERTFFGVLRVETDGTADSEYSGTTLHGRQYLGDRRTEPTIYYVRTGPMGEVIRDLQARKGSLSVGVVGLGVGTAIDYERPTDRFAFFEIDQVVVEIANDARYFTNLRDAPVPPRVVIGDARLSLASEPVGSFDLLILDAFSSDSVPVHLLTREAMATYARALRPGGLVLFHLSNRYYDLDPPVGATARSLGFGVLAKHYRGAPDDPNPDPDSASIWVVAGAAGDMARFAAAGWTEPRPGTVLTDDFADLLSALRSGGP